MSQAAKNLLVIMSDEHSPKILGCYGHTVVKTPNLDALATRGTLFSQAYCTSPVCIPARASFAVGKYIHQIGHWDNADAYDGAIPSWHHRLRDRGHEVVSIGKLHFRMPGEDHGFTEEVIPMHVIEGKGDLMGLVRSDLPVRKGAYKMARLAGPGESQYTYYDREIASRAQVWLRESAKQRQDATGKPWVLFVSFVCPHFPLTAPPEHYYRYYDQALPMPKAYEKHERPLHPFLLDYAGSFNYDDYFDREKVKRAIAGYYGLCSFLDENVGKVLQALDDAGLADDTRVLYTSDHGDNLGARGLWGKTTLFEEAAAVPLIMAGSGIEAGKVVSIPVSHVDFYPFVFDATGNHEPAQREDYPGTSLFELADGATPDRNVLVEYHGMGSTSGAFMIRHGKWKYVYYSRYPAQLFDLEADPEELIDLSADPRHGTNLDECHQRLLRICDPDVVDSRARARQAALLEESGGRDAVIARGDLGFTPAPGAVIAFD
jgi:choline-sulfatase